MKLELASGFVVVTVTLIIVLLIMMAGINKAVRVA